MSTESSSQIKEAVVRYHEFTAEESIRAMYERREKARRDYMSNINWAREQGEYNKARSIAKKLIQIDLPLETIITVTGLTREEVENLRN